MRLPVTKMTNFLEEVLRGLGQEQKTLPCKYLYDARGSQIFEEICELADYYPTRTEFEIMNRFIEQMADQIGEEVLLIEYGSGSGRGRKTRLLLDNMRAPTGYVPIDISEEMLAESASAIANRYPNLKVNPICADYLSPIEIPALSQPVRRHVIYFPGSTIGNFDPPEALKFLSRMVKQVGTGGGVLIGVDLRKDPELLERAYDDSEGVTAKFNLNLLVRINRELEADFPVDAFRHMACWNGDMGRIEMRLVCDLPCKVTIMGQVIHFSAGEYIHTENAYKYDVAEFESLAVKAGLSPQTVWMDAAENFSVHYFTVPEGAC